MPISGTLVGTQTEANLTAGGLPVGDFTDTISLSADVFTDDWLFLVQLGGYTWQNTYLGGSPGPDTPDATQFVFEDMSDAAFAAPGNVVPQFNAAVHIQANSDGSVVYVDDSYPVLGQSAIGLLGSDLATSHSIDLPWVVDGDTTRVEARGYFLTKINGAPFDNDGFGEGIWLEGSSPSTSTISPTNIASGTSSYALTVHAAAAAAAGKGAAALVSVAWDDTDQMPTIPTGWTLLSNWADTTSGWAGLLAGRSFASGDSGPYMFSATFSSSVKSATCFDTWQLQADAVHINHRI